MNFKEKLSKRIGIYDIREILHLTHQNDKRKQELYHLIFDKEYPVGYQAAWVCIHFSLEDNQWLFDKQDELINELLVCKHAGKRRVLLNLLYKHPFPNPPRVDFLDFCLERILSGVELPGVQALCMKIAYELCLPILELKQEFKITLEMMHDQLTPAICAVRKNLLKAILTSKTLQKF
ncbi:MAG: hypothetical protein LIP01_05070 [Tannerellaceae bacterium]|nr:hypothetical protein [Tannerellaceae bacterium]